MKGGGNGGLGLDAEGRHIFVAQQAAVLLGKIADAAGDIAAIEEVANGVHGLLAAGAGGQGLFLDRDHGAQGARQVRLSQNLAGPGDVPIGQEDTAGSRPTHQVFGGARDGVGTHLVNREAVGQLDGRLHGLGERLGSKIA